jgi:hypothetical protein
MPVAAEVGDWGLLCGTRVIQGLAQVSHCFEPFFILTAEYIKDKIFTQGINKNNFSDLFQPSSLPLIKTLQTSAVRHSSICNSYDKFPTSFHAVDQC